MEFHFSTHIPSDSENPGRPNSHKNNMEFHFSPHIPSESEHVGRPNSYKNNMEFHFSTHIASESEIMGMPISHKTTWSFTFPRMYHQKVKIWVGQPPAKTIWSFTFPRIYRQKVNIWVGILCGVPYLSRCACWYYFFARIASKSELRHIYACDNRYYDVHFSMRIPSKSDMSSKQRQHKTISEAHLDITLSCAYRRKVQICLCISMTMFTFPRVYRGKVQSAIEKLMSNKLRLHYLVRIPSKSAHPSTFIIKNTQIRNKN